MGFKDTIQIYLAIRYSCLLCEEMEHDFKILNRKYNSIDFHIINLDLGECIPDYNQVIITPSVFINGSLWRTGKVEKRFIIEKLNSISNNNSINQTA